MSLIKCPDCGRDVSDRARTCPNCGSPLNHAEEITPMRYSSSMNIQQTDDNNIAYTTDSKEKTFYILGGIGAVLIAAFNIVIIILNYCPFRFSESSSIILQSISATGCGLLGVSFIGFITYSETCNKRTLSILGLVGFCIETLIELAYIDVIYLKYSAPNSLIINSAIFFDIMQILYMISDLMILTFFVGFITIYNKEGLNNTPTLFGVIGSGTITLNCIYLLLIHFNVMPENFGLVIDPNTADMIINTLIAGSWACISVFFFSKE